MKKKLLILYVIILISMTTFPPITRYSGFDKGYEKIGESKGIKETYDFIFNVLYLNDEGHISTKHFTGFQDEGKNLVGVSWYSVDWIKYLYQLLILTGVFAVLFYYEKRHRKKLKEQLRAADSNSFENVE